MSKADDESKVALAIATGDLSKVSKKDILENAINLGRMAGRIETSNMFSKYGNVASLMALKEVKDSRAYKLTGTWPEFLKSIGLERRKVDEDIQNIDIFGADFLATVATFGLGYRDLRQLRQLEHSGKVVVEDGMIMIGGDEIPLDIEHSNVLQEALQRVVDEAEDEAKVQAKLASGKDRQIKSLIKTLDKHERKAEAMDISEDDLAFAEYMDNLKTSFLGYLLTCSVEKMEETAENMTISKRVALLNTIKTMRDNGELLYQQAVDKYGEGLTEKGQLWRPGK